MEDANQSPRKVLVIEDEPAMIQLITLLLEPHGFVVSGAEDGQKGLAAIEREHPDLVFLDDMMPGMHGGEVYGSMKADDNLKHIPVIGLTAVGKDRAQERINMLFPNVEAYLVKPFSPTDVWNAVNKIFENQSPT